MSFAQEIASLLNAHEDDFWRPDMSISAQACFYTEGIETPPFTMFLEEQAEEKREQAKKLLRFLRKHEGMICLPVMNKPNKDTWGSPVEALTSLIQMENELTKLLQDLCTLASDTNETDLVKFLEDFQAKQKKSREYLEYYISYQQILEERMRETLTATASSDKT